MSDQRKLEDELTNGFICREYADFYGVMDYDFKEKAIEKYRSDPRFNARVKYAVSGIMALVVKYDDSFEYQGKYAITQAACDQQKELTAKLIEVNKQLVAALEEAEYHMEAKVFSPSLQSDIKSVLAKAKELLP